ncbi:MAG: TonB-dependent receptor [Hyphomonadaceae bacterium]
MKFALRSASGVAILASLAGFLPAAAQVSETINVTTVSGPQEAGAGVDQTANAQAPVERERVVVTGSLIAGTPEDAALPVEVFSAEELEEQGSPTAIEFVKSLTASGPTVGEAYYFGGAGLTGSPGFNLRGIGADKTLTLLNGKRTSENASMIPSIALARTEILKDGAAVTYGADATGGVVNFITRDDFVGLEVQGQYKYIDGSDGDYGLSILGGFGNSDTNFLWSAEWEHRSRLGTLDRPDITNPSLVGDNPAPWSTLTNLAGYIPLGARPAYPGANGADPNSYAGEFGSPVGSVYSDFTADSCAAVGGAYGNSYTCSYNYIPYYNLVEEQDLYRVYAQLNTVVTDNVDFHVDMNYGELTVPQVFGSPSQPTVRGAARAPGLTQQYYIPVTNPGFADFAERSGLADYALFGAVQAVTPVTFRALAHGGNPVLGEGNGYGVPSYVNRQDWRVSAKLDGTLGDISESLEGINFDFSATFNQGNTVDTSPDMLTYRLQEALNGFGGPNCNAVDLDPLQFGTQNPAAAGQNGCLWFNPFASSFASQPERGLSNPNYVAGLENDPSLFPWLVDDRRSETTTQSLDIDLVFSGETGIELPGGPIAWGAGMKWRQVEYSEVVPSDYYNGNLQCLWPTQYTTGADLDDDGNAEPVSQNPFPTSDPRFNGCAGGEGPFSFFDINPPDSADRQQFSYFGELALPLHDRVNLSAAVRREDFSGGLGSTVYKVSGKWDVFGPLSIRGSYGTNYQAPPIDLIPGEVNNATRSYDRAARNWRAYQLLTRADVKPEEATAWNAGIIWQSQGFSADHDFQLILDYFDIETENEIAELATHNQILEASTTTASGGGFYFMDCSSPFISRFQFNDSATAPGGQCVQGLTTSDDFSYVRSEYGNAFGQHTSGIDIQVRYSLPLGPGDLNLDLTGTRVTTQEVSARTLDGVEVNPKEDRLGYLNFSTVGTAAPEWRVNAFGAYRWDRHTVRLQANYVSAVQDERAGTQYGENGEDWITGDLYYIFDITDSMRLNLSVVNMFDRMPAPAQVELGYDPRTGGNPLGRTIEIGVKKTF